MDHLTQVVLAAQAAGMSYGKYVALQYELGRSSIPPAMRRKAADMEAQEECRCEVCGRLIPPERKKGAKTCGHICQSELNRRRNMERYREKRKFKPAEAYKCAFCGQSFTPNRRTQRFCNIRCQEAHKRAVRRGEAVASTGMTPGMANRSYGTGVCVICGEKYIKRSARQKTCSSACRRAHIERRRKESEC